MRKYLTLLFPVLLLALPAQAKAMCVDEVPAALAQRRAEALRQATRASLAKKGWTLLSTERVHDHVRPEDALVRITELQGDSPLPTHGRFARVAVVPGDVLRRAGEDGGAPRPLLLIRVDRADEERHVFARDADGNVFRVELDLAEKPTRTVRLCGCAPRNRPVSTWVGVPFEEGMRLKREAYDAPLVTVRVSTVQFRWSSDRSCHERS